MPPGTSKLVREGAIGRRSGPSQSPPDSAWIRQIQAGRTELYGELVKRYQDRVFNTCWRICGSMEDARDLTQDAFLKAFTSLREFRGKSGFYTWLYRIAVNLALSHRRSQKLRMTQALDQALDASGTQAQRLHDRVHGLEDDDPAARVAQGELHRRVAAELHRLDDDHRAVIVLRDVEGLDYRQISTILGIPPGTVKSRLHRAREELRRTLLGGETLSEASHGEG